MHIWCSCELVTSQCDWESLLGCDWLCSSWMYLLSTHGGARLISLCIMLRSRIFSIDPTELLKQHFWGHFVYCQRHVDCKEFTWYDFQWYCINIFCSWVEDPMNYRIGKPFPDLRLSLQCVLVWCGLLTRPNGMSMGNQYIELWIPFISKKNWQQKHPGDCVVPLFDLSFGGG